jgi:small subunit ribosomal protein S25e
MVKLMGGAKKLSLAQAEKRQRMQSTKQEQEQKQKGKLKETADKKAGGVSLQSLAEKDLVAELNRMRAITPYQVASRFGIKISAAKDVLQRVERRGHIKLVAGNSSLKIYRPILA